jgi:hypothetical protein
MHNTHQLISLMIYIIHTSAEIFFKFYKLNNLLRDSFWIKQHIINWALLRTLSMRLEECIKLKILLNDLMKFLYITCPLSKIIKFIWVVLMSQQSYLFLLVTYFWSNPHVLIRVFLRTHSERPAHHKHIQILFYDTIEKIYITHLIQKLW